MAVHGQYPHTTKLFFSERILQRSLVRNLPLHPRTPQARPLSIMFPGNGVEINSRKRKAVADITTPPSTPNIFSLQHQRRPQSTLFPTALRLDDVDEVQPPPSTTQKICCTPFLSFTSLLNEDRYAEMVEQGDQIDGIIKTHAEQLRRTLADKWQSHYRTLLRSAEERASKRLKERELELEKAVRRNADLEQRAARFRAEAHVWQAKAKMLEETTASLTAALQQAELRGARGSGGGAEDVESSYVDPERVEPVSLACKACEKRAATVMMWPCRHVCVCSGCDAVSKTCPVCLSTKTTSVEVFIS